MASPLGCSSAACWFIMLQRGSVKTLSILIALKWAAVPQEATMAHVLPLLLAAWNISSVILYWSSYISMDSAGSCWFGAWILGCGRLRHSGAARDPVSPQNCQWSLMPERSSLPLCSHAYLVLLPRSLPCLWRTPKIQLSFSVWDSFRWQACLPLFFFSFLSYFASSYSTLSFFSPSAPLCMCASLFFCFFWSFVLWHFTIVYFQKMQQPAIEWPPLFFTPNYTGHNVWLFFFFCHNVLIHILGIFPASNIQIFI